MAERRTLFQCEECFKWFFSMDVFSKHACCQPNANEHSDMPEGPVNMPTGPINMQIGSVNMPTGPVNMPTGPMLNLSDKQNCTEFEFSGINLTEDMNNNLIDEQIKVQEEEEMSLKWSKQATLLLISEYKERLDKIESGKLRKNRAFEEISNELCKAGYMFTKDQCTGRMKTITRAYKLVKDHNSKSGNDKKSYVFEEELDEVYKARPNIKPTYVLGTLQQEENAQSDKETEKKEKVKKRHSDSDSEGTFNESTPKVRKTQASTVISYLETVTKSIDERHRQEQTKKDERHNERMGIFRELINTLKEKK